MMPPSRRPILALCLLPFLMHLALLAFLAFINWDYLAKFFGPVMWDGEMDRFLGLKTLATSFGFSLAASGMLVVMCLRPGSFWRYFASISLSLLFWVAGALLLLLGPAAFTMAEQMRQMR